MLCCESFLRAWPPPRPPPAGASPAWEFGGSAGSQLLSQAYESRISVLRRYPGALDAQSWEALGCAIKSWGSFSQLPVPLLLLITPRRNSNAVDLGAAQASLQTPPILIRSHI